MQYLQIEELLMNYDINCFKSYSKNAKSSKVNKLEMRKTRLVKDDKKPVTLGNLGAFFS